MYTVNTSVFLDATILPIGVYNYLWTLPVGLTLVSGTVTTEDINVTSNTAGFYTVNLQVFTAANCLLTNQDFVLEFTNVPTGVCCGTDGSCSVTTQAGCTTTWTPGGDCLNNNGGCVGPFGVCCNPANNSCTEITEFDCNQIAGSSWQLGGSCNAFGSGAPCGRCCDSNTGDCTYALSCSNGSFQAGVGCPSNGSCNPTGSCCVNGCFASDPLLCSGGSYSPLSCAQRIANNEAICQPPGADGWECPGSGECTFTGLQSNGAFPTQNACHNASPCQDNPIFTGACCNGTTCSVTTLAACLGTYQGNNVPCTAATCASTATGSCCVGTTCTVETNVNCTTLGGIWTNGGSCVPNLCTCVGMDGQFISTEYDSNVDFAYINAITIGFCPTFGFNPFGVRWSTVGNNEDENVFLYNNTACPNSTIIQLDQAPTSFFVTAASVQSTLNGLLSAEGSTATVSFAPGGLTITDPNDEVISASISTRSLVLDAGACTVTSVDPDTNSVSESGCC